MPFRTKRVYETASPDDGFRLLTMRLWPRGIKKDQISRWEKELGPSKQLLDDYRSSRTEWDEFDRRYREEMASKEELLRECADLGRNQIVTLLCGCRDETHCHRTILKKILEAL